MLGFSRGYSTNYRRLNMLLQMIELEEVCLEVVNDETLEQSSGALAYGIPSSTCMITVCIKC
jgi:hypothetical protein